MKRGITLLLLVLALATLALSASLWLAPLLTFIGANTDLIQGLQAGIQILLWLGAAAVLIVGYLRGRQQSQPVSKVETGGGLGVTGNVVVENGNVIGHDLNIIIAQSASSVLRGLRAPLSEKALQQATEAYYHALLDRHRYLNLRGMGVADRIPLKLPLLDLYVPLKARVELPEGETWRRDPSTGPEEALMLAGRRLPDGEAVELAGRLSEPLPVLDLLQKHDGLIVLGDPGAGKTTFLKFLALKLALGEGASLGLSERLPVLAPLSAYANALSEKTIRLDDFIVQHVHDNGADLPFQEMLRAALDAGQALVLLDGLDEVKDLALRETVAKQVTAFYTFQRRKGNRFVLTSRVVGYREARLTADGLAECTLVDFDDNEIAAFVARWTAALERQAQGEGGAARTDAARERRELLDAIRRNASVRRLAANPLLLTILALMKRQGVTLPERRVELYDQYVRTLLSTWNRARGLGRPPAHDLDVVQTIRVLAPLALWMHEVNPGVGLVKREDLRRKLEAIYEERGETRPEDAAQRFLEDVHGYAGLLLERGAGQYGFIHLTFEEYLAAVAIALRGQGDCRPIVDCLKEHLGDPAWHEVALLTVGYLGIIQQLERVAGDVVETLAADRHGSPGEAAALAGEAVLDAWPGGVPRQSKDRVVAALVTTMQDANVPAVLRRRAGLSLGRLGWQPADLEEFVEAPDGEFLYGDEKQKRRIPYRYWIGKYPVTNARFERFIADQGYERQELWSADGWAWRNSAEADLSFIEDKQVAEAYRNWLAGRPRERRGRPFWWDDAERSNPLFPVVGVSWFEAEAYCRWLNDRLQGLPAGDGEMIPKPSNYVVRLPTEEEWERAARGAAGQEYPWSGDVEFANANVADETGKGIGATAVCTYPEGVSPVGAWDMSGNVWEWTGSIWAPEEPYRVVRGGSWGYNRGYARCAVRGRRVPAVFLDDVGFRVVASLSS